MSVQPLYRLLPLVTKAYFPKEQIGEVEERFGVIPHIEAGTNGIRIESDSAKNLWAVILNGKKYAVKVYNALSPNNQRSVMHELDGRVIANLVHHTAKEDQELRPHAEKIFIAPAIGYEHGNNVVLVTDFIDNSSHLNTELAKGLSPELRALGIQIPLLTGVNQFSTSSFLCQLKTDPQNSEPYIEVSPIDLESISKERDVDHNTKILFHLLKNASKGEEAQRFIHALETCGGSWHEAISDEQNRNHLATLIRAVRGGVLIQDTMAPEEISQNTLETARHYHSMGFVLRDTEEGQPPSTLRNEQTTDIDITNIFNYTHSLNLVGGDVALLKEILGIGYQDIPTRITNLKESIQARDYKEVGRKAHTIKGSLLSFIKAEEDKSANKACELALKIEILAISENPDNHFEEIRSCSEELFLRLNEVLIAFKQKINE